MTSAFKETNGMEYVEVTQKEGFNFLSAPRFESSGWTMRRMRQGNEPVAELFKHNGIPVLERDLVSNQWYKYLTAIC